MEKLNFVLKKFKKCFKTCETNFECSKIHNIMNTSIALKTSIQDADNIVILINDAAQLEGFSLSKDEMNYAQKCLDVQQNNFAINQYKRWVFVQVLGDCRETARKAANSLHASIIANKIEEVDLAM